MNFANTIGTLRDKAGLTQQDVARAAGIAVGTYVKLEKGIRQPRLDELKGLSQFFEVSIEALASGKAINLSRSEPIENYSFGPGMTETKRDDNPELIPEKLRDVLLYVLDKVGAKPNVGETVLYKLLYFIDFDYYEKTGKSITGLTYVRNHYGPVPQAKQFDGVIEAMKKAGELEIAETKYFKNTQKKYLPRVSSKLDSLSAGELRHIDETLDYLGDKNARELTDRSHYDMPWLAAKQNQPLHYRDVFYRSGLTAVTEPEDDL